MPTTIDVFAKARDFDRAELLHAVREAGALPYFRELTGPAGPVVEMEGAERVMLGSNNYLGLTGDERVKQGARDALERYGTGLTGSRLLNGTIALHLELEREIADWMGTEEALVFTTGHQANVGTLGTILAPGDTVVAASAAACSRAPSCARFATGGSTSSKSSSSAPPRTAAASWSWSTASTRWRATSRPCRPSATSPSATAPA